MSHTTIPPNQSGNSDDNIANVGSVSSDGVYLRRALDLARAGIGLSSPNPSVGAVVVTANGEMVGEGTHLYSERKHAEIIAMEQAEHHAPGCARGGTLYLNLEPCSHFGRTPPCATAIIEAGIRRVVVAMEDPNPQVAGEGLAMLRAAGVEVEIARADSPIAVASRTLNEAFAAWIRRRTPLVTLKAGMTLDGKIAPAPMPSSAQVSPLQSSMQSSSHFSGRQHVEPGLSQAAAAWITGAAARAHVQELRHQHDAIMVGVGTVIADNPLLTDRSSRPRRLPLIRVVLDSRLRLPLRSRIVQTAQEDVIVFCSLAEEKKRRQLEESGIRVEQVPLAQDGHPDLRAVVHRLGTMNIISLLIEGGAMVNWAALSFGIVDKVFLYYAPRILGGTKSIPFAAGAGFASMAEAATLQSLTLHRFGEDFAVEGYLKDPYKD